jgi:hypothetical protein
MTRKITASAAAVALALLVFASAALAVTLKGGARYIGTTSQELRVQLRLSGDAKRIARLTINYRVKCDDGRTVKTFTKIVNVRVRSTGSFTGHGSYTGSGDGSENVFDVSGRLSRRVARGVFRLTATGEDAMTGETVKCRTGRLTFRAPRR